MLRKWRAGKTVILSKFPVGNAAKARSKKNKGSTPSYKKMQNDMSAVHRLTRILNCNYSHGDYWITLKYDDPKYAKLLDKVKKAGKELTPDNIWAEAVHERDLFLRRLKRDMKAHGMELRYVAVTSDIDGETGEAVRVHHHLVMQKEAFDFVSKHWPKEITRYDPLRDQDSYRQLAEYLIRQAKKQPDQKKYTTSHNMKQPEFIGEEILHDGSELVAPRGSKVLYRSKYEADNPSSQYMEYIPPTVKVKRGGKRE